MPEIAPGRRTIDDPPASPSAFDYEFEAVGSALPASWIWVNQGTSTYSEANGAGLLTVPGGTPDTFRGIVRPIDTATSWTLKSRLGVAGSGGNYANAGLALYDSTGTGAYCFGITQANQIQLAHFTNPTTFGANDHVGSTQMGVAASPLYLAIRKNSATSFDFMCSGDGLAWTTVVSAFNPSLITPSHFGLYADSNNSQPVQLACQWFRVA